MRLAVIAGTACAAMVALAPGAARADGPADIAGASGANIAVVTFGPPDGAALAGLAQVAGVPRYAALIGQAALPARLRLATRGTPFAEAARSEVVLARFGRALGRSIAAGGALARTALPRLAVGVRPEQIGPISGVALTFVPEVLAPGADRLRDTFAAALLGALRRARVPSVEPGTDVRLPVFGLQTTTRRTGSSIAFFRNRGVTTIDDADSALGRISLERVVNGARGAFGQGRRAADGPVAPEPAAPAPLRYRPSAAYRPSGEVYRDAGDGIPGGPLSALVLLVLLAAAAVASTQAARRVVRARAEAVRRARRRRRRSSATPRSR